MPIIEFSKKDLLQLVGKEMSDKELEDNMFKIKAEAEISGDDIKCELTPDRPDLLSVEGVARALKSMLDLKAKEIKTYDTKLSVKGESEVRPAMLAATIKGVTLSDDLVKSLMQIQEKLHTTIGRDRKKVAIGVHDLDKIKGKIEYKDYKPEDIKFVPLMKSEEMNLREILEKHEKGICYAHLLTGPKWPVFTDDEGVLSFPPIINSERTKVTENTKNLFIDVTGTDEKAVETALNILLLNVAERCGEIGTVKVNNKKYPRFETKKMDLEVEQVNKLLGTELEDKEIISALQRMQYDAKIRARNLHVLIPCFRFDILHSVDIIEDVAIGYGYDKLEPTMFNIDTVGELSEIEILSKKIREMMIGLQFVETMNFVLSSKKNNFNSMKLDGSNENCVEILNPVTNDYSICRTWLVPSLLKVLSANKHVDYPQKIFEVGNVVLLDDSTETKTKTVRKLAGVISHDNTNLTEIKSIVEAILKYMGLKYEIRSMQHPSFIKTRVGEIFVEGKSVGFFGEINPSVLENWKLERPVIVFEMSVVQ